jgi:hypothetical protein
MKSASPALRIARWALVLAFLGPGSGAAQSPAAAGGETPTDLAKKKENPVSNLVNLPLEFDWSYKAGQFERTAFALNLQPVWPMKLGGKWNLIPRLVLPVLGVPVGAGSRKTGLGDSTLALFLSPQEPASWGKAGVVWGVGPIVLAPTATSPLLGFREWGVGPTAAMVVTDGPWVTVALAQNTWSVDGIVNQFLFQAIVNDNFESGFAVYRGRTSTRTGPRPGGTAGPRTRDPASARPSSSESRR